MKYAPTTIQQLYAAKKAAHEMDLAGIAEEQRQLDARRELARRAAEELKELGEVIATIGDSREVA